MGLSDAEVASVRATWKSVSGDLQKVGTGIFVQFLTTHPDQQAYFKKFDKVAKGDLAKNDEVAKQGLVVMEAVTKIIAVLDKPDALKEVVKPIAINHKARNVTLPNFQKMFPVIVDYIVKNASGDKAAWTKTLDALGAVIDAAQK